MLNNIEGKEKNSLSPSEFFNHLDDEDFMMVIEAGHLKTLCDALSLDLNSNPNEKNTTYTA